MENTVRLLKRIGFSSTTYLEAVALLYGDDGSIVNVVPLGFKLRDGYIVSKVYRGGRTYEAIVGNLVRSGCICITQDARLFYLSIFEKDRAIKLFTNREDVCDAIIEFAIESTDSERNSILMYAKPLAVKILRRIPRGFTRASASIIEALVWLTKIPYTSKKKRAELVKHIELCLESIHRSSRSKIYKSIARKIHIKMQKYINA
ncbi:MAG: DUF447 family protein [Ignisphaera sp.]